MSRRSAVDRVAPRANSTTEAFLQHLDDQRCILSSVALAVKEVARLFGALVGLKVSDSRGESLVLGVDNHFLFQILQLLQGDVEEIARATGRIEDGDVLKAMQKT